MASSVAVPVVAEGGDVSEPSSYTNGRAISTASLHIVWTVDFAAQALRGHVDLCCRACRDNVTELILDTRTLAVSNVVDVATGADLKFTLLAEHEVFGAALVITLAAPLASGGQAAVRVFYSTSPASSAIQWLQPSQTAGKTHPYMFTQCQAIHARSLLPCQDTPSIKVTYTAQVSVPAPSGAAGPNPLVALMSALSEPATPEDATATDVSVFRFSQPVPTPSYLIALAVGALESRDLGPRTKLWSEKEMVERGAWEFSETDKFIRAGEDLLGPYVWGRYDLLLLPPSFPYGGMENPCLTFITPTCLAGDRSLTNVVAHEIAHSWTGNLVGCCSWEHFWLNEGFTVFVERRILESVISEEFARFHADIGLTDLKESVDHFGHNAPFTALVPKLAGQDPDDAFSSVPYEKGFNFLYYLQGLVGGPAAFNSFLRAYVERYARVAISSSDFKSFFLDFFSTRCPAESLQAIDWEAWLYGTGFLPHTPNFHTPMAEACTQLANKWLSDSDAVQSGDVAGWSTAQIVLFLEKLTAQQDTWASLKTAIPKMDSLYNLSASHNAEVRLRWQTLSIAAGHAAIIPHVEAFLGEQGRMKFVRPLYRALLKHNGKDYTAALFERLKAGYHSIARKMVATDLGVTA
eukprot:gnl/Hemi2/27646_TR9135_c0_g1_i1.p1 gnl/Hemi2/27646_TR9135_c0_g1~~gnl/Hemi2/27646_TR9135_c0_g1_i1.p1  ORF type:complete len:635 (+),score=190.18 gnl/Hemi2/27646_TR9135_c0_g1_i1:43-1947(+)